MSYIFSESYIRQKLRRLEEVNEYNKAKLEMYAKKQSFSSQKEYERYKKILLGTDYREQKESLANSINQEMRRSSQDIRQKLAAQRHGQQQRQQPFKSKDKESQYSIAGNILSKKSKQHIPFSQQKQLIRQQQKSNQTNGISSVEFQKDQANKEGKFQTPRQSQQQQQQFQNQEDNDLKSNGIFNTAQFKSTLNSSEQEQLAQKQYYNHLEQQLLLNQQKEESVKQQQSYYQHKHQQSNSESILHQTNIVDDSTFEQVQLLRNIRLLQMEKRELESQLKDLSAKERNLSTNEISCRSNKKRSLYEGAHSESINSVQNPLLASRSFIESLQPSSSKIEFTKSQVSSTPHRSYCQLEKSIGLDFNSQWEMLEKFEPVEKYQASDKLFKGYNTIGPLDWLLEDSVDQQVEEKQTQNEESSMIYPQRIVHSFLPDENWSTQFNKIGKTHEEPQKIVDNSEKTYFEDFLSHTPNLNPKVRVSSPQLVNNIVCRYTIDKLSEEIDQFMQKTRFGSPQSSSLGSYSPFAKKRSLKVIPEEQQSHNTTLNC